MNSDTRKKTQPEQPLTLTAKVDIEAAAASGKRPKATILAYTGGPMKVGGWGPVVVDLAGLKMPETVTLLGDHENRLSGVLGSGTPELRGGKELWIVGTLADSMAAKEVIALAKSGVELQASVGVDVTKAKEVRPGEEATVNGRNISSNQTIYIVQGQLKEVSIVPAGADANTFVDIAAKHTTFDGDNAVDKKQLEQERRAKVRELAKDHPTIAASAVDENWTPERTELEVLRAKDRQRQLDDLRASYPVIPWAGRTGDATAGGNDVLKAAALLSVGYDDNAMVKAGDFKPEVVEAAHPLRSIGIQELCARAAAAEGVELPRFRADASGWLRAAFSTMNVPNILSNVANKSLLDAFLGTEQTWRAIAKIGSVKDFKEASRMRLTSDATFVKVGSGGELKHGSTADESYTVQADTYGRMFGLTRQQIINDDLGALNDMTQHLGCGAGEGVNEVFWTAWLAAVAGAAFWTAARGNFDDGADSALDIDGLTAADILFGSQTKPDIGVNPLSTGKPLGLSPEILLVPLDLRAKAQQLMTSVEVRNPSGSAQLPISNPHAGRYRVESSSYIRSTDFHASASTTAWWLLANPNRLASIEIAFLNGQQRPTIEQAEADFNTLGLQFRGYFDFGVSVQDYRASVMMAGA